LRVRDAMMTRFRTLAAPDTLARAVDELLAGSQQDFPVLENNQLIGILRRNDLVKALSDGRRDTQVTEGMSRDCEVVDEASSLKSAVESMRERKCATIPVVAAGRIVGLLTLENISEMIMVNSAMDHQGETPSMKAMPDTNLQSL
jgi:predicted transcriptional regulator